MKTYLEDLFFEVNNRYLAERLRTYVQRGFFSGLTAKNMPDRASRAGVPKDIYHGFRRGSVPACADIVLVQDREGEISVPLILRSQPPFKGCFWPQGGGIFNGRSVSEFLLWKASRELGLHNKTIDVFAKESPFSNTDVVHVCKEYGISIMDIMGVARTTAEADDNAPDDVCDTVNLCYIGILDSNASVSHDKDHSQVKFFTREELVDSNPCGHWYPRWAALKAIDVAIEAKRRERRSKKSSRDVL